MIAIPFDVQWGTDIRADNLFHLARQNVARPSAAGGTTASSRDRHAIIQIASCSPAVGLSSTDRHRLGQHLRSRPLHNQQLPAPDELWRADFSGLVISPHAPQDHALAVRAPQSSDPPLSEMGACPIVGIFTIDDAFSTTWAQIRSGSTATTTFPCVAPLDTGPPQTFIEGARRQLQTAGADSPLSDRISALRSMGGLRTSALLRKQGSENMPWFNRATVEQKPMRAISPFRGLRLI